MQTVSTTTDSSVAEALQDKNSQPHRKGRNRGPGLCRTAAGRRVRQSRIRCHRHRRAANQSRRSSTPAIPTCRTFRLRTLRPLVEPGKLSATTDFSVVKDLDTINICVPDAAAEDQRSRT